MSLHENIIKCSPSSHTNPGDRFLLRIMRMNDFFRHRYNLFSWDLPGKNISPSLSYSISLIQFRSHWPAHPSESLRPDLPIYGRVMNLWITSILVIYAAEEKQKRYRFLPLAQIASKGKCMQMESGGIVRQAGPRTWKHMNSRIQGLRNVREREFSVRWIGPGKTSGPRRTKDERETKREGYSGGIRYHKKFSEEIQLQSLR